MLRPVDAGSGDDESVGIDGCEAMKEGLSSGTEVDCEVEILKIDAGRVDGNKRTSSLRLHPLFSVNAAGHGTSETFALTMN